MKPGVYLKDKMIAHEVSDDAVLAYNVFYAIADRFEDPHFTSDLTQEDLFAIEESGLRGEERETFKKSREEQHDMILSKEDLHVIDENGNSLKPELDPEWYGTEEENEKIKQKALDKIMENAARDGEELDREFEETAMQKYQVNTVSEALPVRVTPSTWDIYKASRMCHILQYSIYPYQLSFEDEQGERIEIERGCSLFIASEDDVPAIYESANDKSFEDAVNSLPDNAGMEL